MATFPYGKGKTETYNKVSRSTFGRLFNGVFHFNREINIRVYL